LSVCRLIHLLETGQFQPCLEEAMALLAAGSEKTPDAARIYAAVCRCRLEMTDSQAAADAGMQALSLAEAGQDIDLLGAVLADLGAARLRLKQYAPALEALDRYLTLLPRLGAASCKEGAVRQQMAHVLQRLGFDRRAADEFTLARRWFDRFGDEKSAWACVRSLIAQHLGKGELREALRLLEEGELHMPGAARPFQSDQLLDWARFLTAAGRPDTAAERAFAALELAEGLEQQGMAQWVLCQTALAQEKPVEALAFALAARVSAIEGQLYSLEFDASEVIFRLLRRHGEELLSEVAAHFEQQGVDIYDYLSELAVRRSVT